MVLAPCLAVLMRGQCDFGHALASTPLVRGLFQYGERHVGLGHVWGSLIPMTFFGSSGLRSVVGINSYPHRIHFCFSISITLPYASGMGKEKYPFSMRSFTPSSNSRRISVEPSAQYPCAGCHTFLFTHALFPL